MAASIPQLAARESHNLEVVSSNLTRGICFILPLEKIHVKL